MLLAPVRLTVVTKLAGDGAHTLFTTDRLPEHHAGTGKLVLMGVKGVAFRVHYDVVLLRVVHAGQQRPQMLLRGKVGQIVREDGGPLPEGVYALEDVPQCRLTYFGQRWRMPFG